MIRDSVAFAVGAFMLIYETVFAEKAQPILVVAGVAALGVTGSGMTQRLLRFFLEEDEKDAAE